jgi:hypothetical protein
MALSLSIDLCLQSNCTDLIFKETTGAYSLSNTGGWGSPNPVTGASYSAVLTATDPDGNVHIIDLYALSTFPKNDATFEYTIPIAQFSPLTSITDGLWTFVYTVDLSNNGTDLYTATSSKVFTCSINCCLDNILTKIKADNCDSCDSNYYTYEEYVKLLAYRDALENAADCGDTDYIADILEIASKLCNKSKCKTCN